MWTPSRGWHYHAAGAPPVPCAPGAPSSDLGAFSENARAALDASPDYFLWWYTAKSVGLVVAVSVLAYFLGREHGRRR